MKQIIFYGLAAKIMLSLAIAAIIGLGMFWEKQPDLGTKSSTAMTYNPIISEPLR